MRRGDRYPRTNMCCAAVVVTPAPELGAESYGLTYPACHRVLRPPVASPTFEDAAPLQ